MGNCLKKDKKQLPELCLQDFLRWVVGELGGVGEGQAAQGKVSNFVYKIF